MRLDSRPMAVLSAFRIPTARSAVAHSANEALVVAQSLGFPVAMKIVSPEIVHKSDVGGVQLNLYTGRAVRDAVRAKQEAAAELIPELQGRFPIRVELQALGEEDLVRILTEPRAALVTQYRELLGTEGVGLHFTEDAVREIARLAAQVNDQTENIGARRLATILETVLDEVSFEAGGTSPFEVTIDSAYVHRRLDPVVDGIAQIKVLTSNAAALTGDGGVVPPPASTTTTVPANPPKVMMPPLPHSSRALHRGSCRHTAHTRHIPR